MNEQTKPHYLGHRERLRERFRKAGSEGRHDYELLELLLTYAIPRKEFKPIAKNLTVEIKVINHIIVGRDGYFSFAEKQLIKKEAETEFLRETRFLYLTIPSI